MGSSGSDRFSDYSGSQSGSSKENLCDKAFSCSLEDVATSNYFQSNKSVPASGSKIKISPNLHQGRIVATLGSMIIGNLPTRFNYLLKCFTDGISYEGVIANSGTNPIPFIVVDVAPI